MHLPASTLTPELPFLEGWIFPFNLGGMGRAMGGEGEKGKAIKRENDLVSSGNASRSIQSLGGKPSDEVHQELK
jgi:hypothetical protein